MPTNITDLEKRLWDAADELRANSRLKASEYGEPVLGLLFLRYADARFAEAEKRLAGQRDRPAAAIGKHHYQAEGVLYLPEAARFSHLLRLPEGDNLGKAINDAMQADRGGERGLKGVLPRTYNRLEQRHAGRAAASCWPRSRSTSRATPSARSTSTSSATSPWPRARRAASSSRPPRIVRLIVEIIEPFHGRIFDPACGSGGMFVQSRRLRRAPPARTPTREITIYGQEKAERDGAAGKMNLAVHGLSGDIREANSYYEDPHDARRQVRLRDGQSAVQRRPGRQGAAQGRHARFPLRHAEHRQRQLPLDPALLRRAERRAAAPASSWRTPPATRAASELEIRKKLHRDRRGGRDGRDRLQLLLHRDAALHALVPRPGQGRDGARRTRCCSSTPGTSSARSTGPTATSRPSRSSSWRTSSGSTGARSRRLTRGQRGADGGALPGRRATRDVPGLCKVATLAEIEAQGWSLNPGRYVGVAERAADEFDFAERLEELNEELERSTLRRASWRSGSPRTWRSCWRVA